MTYFQQLTQSTQCLRTSIVKEHVPWSRDCGQYVHDQLSLPVGQQVYRQILINVQTSNMN